MSRPNTSSLPAPFLQSLPAEIALGPHSASPLCPFLPFSLPASCPHQLQSSTPSPAHCRLSVKKLSAFTVWPPSLRYPRQLPGGPLGSCLLRPPPDWLHLTSPSACPPTSGCQLLTLTLQAPQDLLGNCSQLSASFCAPTSRLPRQSRTIPSPWPPIQIC